MKKPGWAKNRSLKILGQKVRVCFVESVEMDGRALRGDCAHDQNRISIWYGQDEQSARETMMHEILEYLRFGLILDNRRFNHARLSILSVAITQILSENKWLLEWFAK